MIAVVHQTYLQFVSLYIPISLYDEGFGSLGISCILQLQLMLLNEQDFLQILILDDVIMGDRCSFLDYEMLIALEYLLKCSNNVQQSD